MRKTSCVKIRPVHSRVFHLLQLDKVELRHFSPSTDTQRHGSALHSIYPAGVGSAAILPQHRGGAEGQDCTRAYPKTPLPDSRNTLTASACEIALVQSHNQPV
jgi:hypothetical protein